MVAQGGSSVRTYSLENLELEYETIENIDIANEVTSSYSSGRSLAFEHCTLRKTTVWDKAAVLINKNVNLPANRYKLSLASSRKPLHQPIPRSTSILISRTSRLLSNEYQTLSTVRVCPRTDSTARPKGCLTMWRTSTGSLLSDNSTTTNTSSPLTFEQ